MMMFLLALGGAAAAAPTWEGLASYTFEDYRKDFGKAYATEAEEAERRAIFEARLSSIRAHNAAGLNSYKKGVNRLTDRRDDERAALNGRDKVLAAAKGRDGPAYVSEDSDALPETFDWRGKGILTAIKDQGMCGSCWAFASTETIESHAALDSGKLVELSPQHLVSCAANVYDCGGTGGCGGSIAELAFEYVQTHGMATEWTYPYTAGLDGATGACRYNASSPIPKAATLDGYVRVPSNDETQVLTALVKEGPLAVNVDATGWHDYESGVFDGCATGGENVDIDHVVQLVGYGKDYLLVRNSWDTTWGEDGFIRLARTTKCGVDSTPLDGTGCAGGNATQHVCGACGVLFDASYPLNARVLST